MDQYKIFLNTEEKRALYADVDKCRNILKASGANHARLDTFLTKLEFAKKVNPIDKAEIKNVNFDSVFFGQGEQIQLRVNLKKPINSEEISPASFLG